MYSFVFIYNVYCVPDLGFKLFMGRPNDRHGFIRPPILKPVDQFTRQPEDQWFEQRVDHFNKQDDKTFKQLYYIDDSHYKTGGPVFLMISGESELDAAYLTTASFMGQMAKKYGALAVTLEHRYFGRSVPTPDLSTGNLKYLTIELALKDLEQFALYLTKKLSLEGSKWVVFGGSYAGKLASWFRQKYPHIAAGAVASSAPVGSTYDCTGYLRVVGEAVGKECSDNIRKANLEIENLLKTPEGVIQLRKTLNLCQSFDGKNINDNRYLSSLLGMTVVMHVQYNTGVDKIVKTMNDPSGGTPLERYAKLQLVGQTLDCVEVNHNKYVVSLQNTTIDRKGMMRQWTYMTCTEFADFPTTDAPDSPFGHNLPVEYYAQQCTDIFGPQITAQTIQRAVNQTVATYGGLKPNVTNVVFPNGSVDPWKSIGVLNDLNNSTKAVILENYGHGGDMVASTPTDPPTMINAHKLIEQQIINYNMFLKTYQIKRQIKVFVFVCNAYSETNGGFKLFNGRPNDRYGFVRPPVITWNQFIAEQFYDQKVDYFNKQDNRTFKQMYYVDDSHYKTGGPVFLMISGESFASPIWVSNATYMGEMAKKYGALAVVLEHRYYGKSIPTPDLSTQNLKYLSSEMALKDTEQFALYLTKKLSLEGNKWVVFGGSYAGNLYPNIAVGAIASSAPVRAAVDAMEFLGVTSESLGKECSENIRKASLEMNELLKTPEGVTKLRKILNLCDTFDGKNVNNNRFLAEQMMWTIVSNALSKTGIDKIRGIMNDTSIGTPLERYSKVTEMIGSSICHDYHYSHRIAPLKNTTIDPMGFQLMRQWIYQTCTEFGYYQSSDLPNSPFEHNIPVEYYTQQCAQVYGPQFTPQSIQKAVDRTNAYYGGLKPNVTNVVFPNGSLDPWHSLSVLKDLNNSTKAVMIEGGDHCSDMWASTSNDSESLKNAHKLIDQQIGEYLK
ncbi:unnamed protein product [Medioppia subpectinata]|uniref:Uncharacterized protein n=1 Tax=Medioppia subpectinata TaxID=1979941 RepID=A0A7R9KD09_9ACAR|nr:unnamed protein product [Medioppia subpectinata]CAG2100980.1 unnamed protein product [Medioppia subpectinata]